MSGLTMLDFKFIDDDNINELLKLMLEEKLPFPSSGDEFNTLVASYGRDKRAILSRQGRVNLIRELLGIGHSAAREATTGAGQNQENEDEYRLAAENVYKNGLDQARNDSGVATCPLTKSGWTASMESVDNSPQITIRQSSNARRGPPHGCLPTSCIVQSMSATQNASANQQSSSPMASANVENREIVNVGTVSAKYSAVNSSNGFVRRFTGAAAGKTSCSTNPNACATQPSLSSMVTPNSENRENVDAGTNESAAKSSNRYIPRFTGPAALEKMLKRNALN